MSLGKNDCSFVSKWKIHRYKDIYEVGAVSFKFCGKPIENLTDIYANNT